MEFGSAVSDLDVCFLHEGNKIRQGGVLRFLPVYKRVLEVVGHANLEGVELGGVVLFDIVGQTGELGDITTKVSTALVQGADLPLGRANWIGVPESYFKDGDDGDDVGEIYGVQNIGGSGVVSSFRNLSTWM